uniref:Uncharacterized protein n=1 Tax=Panagrolaimus davidi TaxID=227884 RepID=A0A914P5G2_9BILA
MASFSSSPDDGFGIEASYKNAIDSLKNSFTIPKMKEKFINHVKEKNIFNIFDDNDDDSLCSTQNTSTSNPHVDMIQIIFPDVYPPEILQLIHRSDGSNIFGRHIHTKTGKHVLGMFDTLNKNAEPNRKILQWLEHYVSANSTKDPPKKGKRTCVTNSEVFQMLFIRYLLLNHHKTPNAKPTLNKFFEELPSILSFLGRLLSFINQSDDFRINVATIMKHIRRATNAISKFANKDLNVQLHTPTFTKASAQEKMQNITYVTTVVKDIHKPSEQLVHHHDEFTKKSTSSGHGQPLLADYQNLTIDNAVILKVMQRIIDQIVGMNAELVKLSVIILGNNRSEVVPYLKLEHFNNAIYDEQTASLPGNIIYYILKNPKTAELYLKMVKTCKYFFVKHPILTVNEFIYDCDKWLVDKILEWTGNKTKVFDLSNITAKVWITGKLKVVPETEAGSVDVDVFTAFMPTLYRCDAKQLYVSNQVLSFHDYSLLIPSAEDITFNHVTIKNENGSNIALEKVVEVAVKAKYIEINSNTVLTNITSSTFKELLKIPHFANLNYFSLKNIPESFDLDAFYSNKTTKYWLIFDDSIPQVYKNRIEAIVDEMLATKVFGSQPPYFDFRGLNHSKRLELDFCDVLFLLNKKLSLNVCFNFGFFVLISAFNYTIRKL